MKAKSEIVLVHNQHHKILLVGNLSSTSRLVLTTILQVLDISQVLSVPHVEYQSDIMLVAKQNFLSIARCTLADNYSCKLS